MMNDPNVINQLRRNAPPKAARIVYEKNPIDPSVTTC